MCFNISLEELIGRKGRNELSKISTLHLGQEVLEYWKLLCVFVSDLSQEFFVSFLLMSREKLTDDMAKEIYKFIRNIQ